MKAFKRKTILLRNFANRERNCSQTCSLITVLIIAEKAKQKREDSKEEGEEEEAKKREKWKKRKKRSIMAVIEAGRSYPNLAPESDIKVIGSDSVLLQCCSKRSLIFVGVEML